MLGQTAQVKGKSGEGLRFWGGTKGGPRGLEGWQGHAEFRLGMVELRNLEIPKRRRTGLSWTHGSVAQTYKSGNGELSPDGGCLVSGEDARLLHLLEQPRTLWPPIFKDWQKKNTHETLRWERIRWDKTTVTRL